MTISRDELRSNLQLLINEMKSIYPQDIYFNVILASPSGMIEAGGTIQQEWLKKIFNKLMHTHGTPDAPRIIKPN